MLEAINIEDILFLDIETVPQAPSMNILDPKIQTLWDKKSKQFRTDELSASDVYERAGIYSEFGKIICISVGYIKEKNPFVFRLKSFFGNDEKMILSEFSAMLTKFSGIEKRGTALCS